MSALRETLKIMRRSIAQILLIYDKRSTELGSGFVVVSDGYVATCSHVIHPQNMPHGAKLAVYLPAKGEGFQASIAYDNKDTDIAILKIECRDLLPVELGGDADVDEGDDIAFYGYPLDINVPTAHKGIVSAKGSYMRHDPESNANLELLQIDASVNRGNSGGPLFLPDNGKVVGVVSQKLVASISGQPAKGMLGVTVLIGGRDYGKEIDQLREEVTQALKLLQLGIGYAISVDYLKEGLVRLGKMI